MYTLIAVALLCWSGDVNTSADSAPRIAAIVAGEAITETEVLRALQEASKGGIVPADAAPGLKAQALEQLIGQRLIVMHLNRQQPGVLEKQVDEAQNTLKIRAETLKVPFDDYLKQQGLNLADWRRQTAWRIGWQSYLDRHMTDELLQQCFAATQRDFDGTQVRVSHLLWRLDRPADPAAIAAAVETAGRVRQQITAGKLSFLEAVKKYSSGPSRDQGGDLGFLERHGPMDGAFLRAAFRLNAGELSSPVVTPFGVHLIQCTEIRPGDKKWTDVRAALRLRVTQQLFEQLAAQERPMTSVEYTGHLPYLQPGTGKLIAQKP